MAGAISSWGVKETDFPASEIFSAATKEESFSFRSLDKNENDPTPGEAWAWASVVRSRDFNLAASSRKLVDDDDEAITD